MSGAAQFRLLPDPERSAATPRGPLRSAQEAELALDPELLERIWAAELPERLGRAYWRFLETRSQGDAGQGRNREPLGALFGRPACSSTSAGWAGTAPGLEPAPDPLLGAQLLPPAARPEGG